MQKWDHTLFIVLFPFILVMLAVLVRLVVNSYEDHPTEFYWKEMYVTGTDKTQFTGTSFESKKTLSHCQAHKLEHYGIVKESSDESTI